ncbi:MAG: YdeI/OmpD-associated family protein [Archangium sp.]|nr:YdeI/OmpD-associated family protein [Archangium sp.]
MNTAIYFPGPAAWRTWLQKHFDKRTELLVGFYKAHTDEPTMTWSESVDEALCFGWIDGRRTGVDEDRYTIRFTPRKPTSIWSRINIDKMAALEKAGKMTDAGRAAFAHRKAHKSGVYSFENRPEKFPTALRKLLDAQKKAAAYFDERAPSYRRAAIWWVISAKQEETKSRRMQQLVELHARGEQLPQLVAYKKPKKKK